VWAWNCTFCRQLHIRRPAPLLRPATAGRVSVESKAHARPSERGTGTGNHECPSESQLNTMTVTIVTQPEAEAGTPAAAASTNLVRHGSGHSVTGARTDHGPVTPRRWHCGTEPIPSRMYRWGTGLVTVVTVTAGPVGFKFRGPARESLRPESGGGPDPMAADPGRAIRVRRRSSLSAGLWLWPVRHQQIDSEFILLAIIGYYCDAIIANNSD
jgi:hypothetical protein